MPKHILHWTWQDAFSKFGFNDGDGWNGTFHVSYFLEGLGYETECDFWGCHNYLILDVLKDGRSILFQKDDDNPCDKWLPHLAHIQKPLGYADPKEFLPKELVEKLEICFHDEYECHD